jgi:hypothetical protein
MMATLIRDEESQVQSESLQDAELSFIAFLLHRAGVKVSRDVTEQVDSNYYFAAGKYYQASSTELRAIEDSGIPVEEFPVILHASRHGTASSEDVVKERVSGESWGEILSRFGVTPNTFYVPLKTGIGGAPTQPDRFNRDSARNAWKAQSFTDKDIVNLANLKFVAEFHGTPPDSIVALLSNGWTFAAIHGELQSDNLVWETRRSASNIKRAG